MPRVNIVLPQDLLDQMDQMAHQDNVNRSQLVRTAVLAYFDLRAQNDERQQRQDDIQRAIDMQDRLRQSVTSWDAMKVLREQRQET